MGDEGQSTCCCLIGGVLFLRMARVKVSTTAYHGSGGTCVCAVFMKGTFLWGLDRD